MIKSILFFVFLSLSLISVTIFPQSNTEQTQEPVLKADTLLYYETDEVVVTGTRFNKKIIDIPYSVVRLDNAAFKQFRKNAVNDVLSAVPGLFMQSRYGNHDVRISIRGFGSRSNSGIRGVRILLDGIPESEPDGQTRIEAIDFNSISAIELVKGNSSSLYTNAPGGVINFITNTYFPSNFTSLHNEFGSFGLRRNGIKTGVRTKDYGLLLTYTYHTYQGFREHSEDYWHILNAVFETTPNDYSKLEILGYFVDGLIRLPGSLTLEEYNTNPGLVPENENKFDFKRVSKKGRIGLRYNLFLGENKSNEIEVTGYGTFKYFERTANREYRLINRYGVGSSFRFVNKTSIADRLNEFSFGGDLLYQAGPVEYYDNIAGSKGDNLSMLVDEAMVNTGIYLQNYFPIMQDKLSLLLSARYDKIVFDQKNQINQSQNDYRSFNAWTPKAALNYKIMPNIAVYGSFGRSFDSPAGNEMDNYPTSSNPGKLLNPDLKPQDSYNTELGIKGNYINYDSRLFRSIFWELTLFNYMINNEIVPFEVYGDIFYRNSAKTLRRGLEASGETEFIEGLRIKLAYTYSDFKYDEYSAGVIDIDSIGTLISRNRNFSGNAVPTIPKHNVTTILSYSRAITTWLSGFIRGSYIHVSDMYVDDENTQKTSAYNLLNGSGGFEFVVKYFNIMVSAGADNILDRKYVGFINLNSTKKRYYEPGAPRTYYGSVSLRYNL